MKRSSIPSPSRRAVLLGLCGSGLLGPLLLPAWAARPKAALGQAAPDFRLPDLGGTATQLADFRGKVVIVDFFASWCEPCLKELPELEKLSRELSQKGVVFLGIGIDQERRNTEDIRQQFGISFKVLLDPQGKVAELYDPPKMPTSYVIDKAGAVRFVNQGFDGLRDIERLRRQIAELSR